MSHRRTSVKAAEGSITRADWYRKACETILYDRKLSIIEDGNQIFLKSEADTSHLVDITNPKTKWFELWLKLKEV
jgi:hypothetical protein